MGRRLQISAIVLVLCFGCSHSRSDYPMLPAERVSCDAFLDRRSERQPAYGLYVDCTVRCDSADRYMVRGEVHQDRTQGPLAHSNNRGEDITYSTMAMGNPNLVESSGGDMRVRLWFPGSEIRRGRRGEAWVDMEVWPHEGITGEPRRYRGHLEEIDPGLFVRNMPGDDPPPPLPRPSRPRFLRQQ